MPDPRRLDPVEALAERLRTKLTPREQAREALAFAREQDAERNECWEPGHTTEGGGRELRVHCIQCTDTAMQTARDKARAEQREQDAKLGDVRGAEYRKKHASSMAAGPLASGLDEPWWRARYLEAEDYAAAIRAGGTHE